MKTWEEVVKECEEDDEKFFLNIILHAHHDELEKSARAWKLQRIFNTCIVIATLMSLLRCLS